MLLENISSVITVVIFAYNCVFCFCILVSVGSQKSSLVWCTLKHGVAHSPKLHSRHLYFVLVLLFMAERKRHRILLHCMSQCLLCLESRFLIQLVDETCLLPLAVWGQGTLPASGIRSLTNVSLNCRCDNFEPQDARMIKLLRMVRSRRWKNSFFVHFQVHLLIEKEFVMQSDLSAYPVVFCSPVLWPVSQLFHVYHRHYLPVVENACSSVCWHFICPSVLWLSSYLSP